jgi:NAD(P)-dependent dehydrogenase (short-subunit alcohol dehydrogenase family)
VLVGVRDAERGKKVAAEIGGRPLVLDVADPAEVAAAAAAVPKLDVLVNNAGISLDTGSVVTETDVEVFRRTYETNVFGVIAVTNAFVPLLRRSAHPRIVNISSGTGSLTWSTGPNPQFDFRAASSGAGAAYQSSKTALNALTVNQGQRAHARATSHQPQPPGGGRRRGSGRGGRGRCPARVDGGRRTDRTTLLLGRVGRAMVRHPVDPMRPCSARPTTTPRKE